MRPGEAIYGKTFEDLSAWQVALHDTCHTAHIRNMGISELAEKK